jgi:hypothetical protein
MNGHFSCTYACWGLTIASELECPEFPTAWGEPDVVVRLGKAPDKLPDVKISGVLFEMGESEFLLRVAGVATFYVREGREIVVDPCKGAEARAIRLYLRGSAFGALLHQRGLAPFHGSAVVLGEGAVILVGPSGAGKSTLAAELCRRGHRLLADDVCVVREIEGGRPRVAPAYPQAKLWTDSLKALEIDRQGLRRVRSDMEKFALPLPPAAFNDKPAAASAVYILTGHNGDAIECDPLSGYEKFTALTDNTYRLRFLQGLADTSGQYRICAALAKHARVVRVRRPKKPFLLRELADMIERESPA